MDTKHEYTNEIVCPYCDYIFEDSWEFSDTGEGEIQCYKCSKNFIYTVNIEITYNTSKINCEDKDNKEEHNYIFDSEYDMDADLVQDYNTRKYNWVKFPFGKHMHVKVYKCTKCDDEKLEKIIIEDKELKI